LCTVKGYGGGILKIRGVQEDDSQEHFGNVHQQSVFFFQFADAVRGVSTPRLIQTDFVKLATLFQGTLKTAASRHKCDGTLHPLPKKLLSVFGDFKWKIPLVLVARVL
jgi:hypothetical protein